MYVLVVYQVPGVADLIGYRAIICVEHGLSTSWYVRIPTDLAQGLFASRAIVFPVSVHVTLYQ